MNRLNLDISSQTCRCCLVFLSCLPSWSLCWGAAACLPVLSSLISALGKTRQGLYVFFFEVAVKPGLQIQYCILFSLVAWVQVKYMVFIPGHIMFPSVWKGFELNLSFWIKKNGLNFSQAATWNTQKGGVSIASSTSSTQNRQAAKPWWKCVAICSPCQCNLSTEVSAALQRHALKKD